SPCGMGRNRIRTGGCMRDDKRDAPESRVTLSVRQFMILWITQLQTEITHQETDADKALFMVRGYDGDDSEWTEIDLYTDDPTNLIDKTWSDPQIWREERSEAGEVIIKSEPVTIGNPPIQIDVTDAAKIIESRGGRVATFEMSTDPWPHYEVTIDGKTYGPMIETELYWFAYGVSLWPKE